MATNAPRSQSGAATAAKPAPMQPAARRADSSATADAPRKAYGYGLPCAKCHLYFPADLDVCPTCRHNERVSPVVPPVTRKAVPPPAEPVPDTSVLEKEREEFLRQLSRSSWKRTPPPMRRSSFARFPSIMPATQPTPKSARDATSACRSASTSAKP